jgi:polyisoprenoid-binding protein YceI
MTTGRRRKVAWWLGAALVVLLLVALVGPFVYIHFIEGPAPAKLALPAAPGRTTSTTSAQAAPAGSANGTWKVGPGSVAGYRVQEVLLGQNATAVGRTDEIWGSLVIDGAMVTKGSFTVNMSSVISDQSQRNHKFDGPIMNVSSYPTATLTLTSPITLGDVPGEGSITHYSATGALNLHGVTRTVSFPVSAERLNSQIDVLADITIPFADWDISNPSVGGFVTTANSGTLEVLLHLTQGTGNPSAAGSGGSRNSGGGGGPVTIPSTTVPPLTVPSS